MIPLQSLLRVKNSKRSISREEITFLNLGPFLPGRAVNRKLLSYVKKARKMMHPLTCAVATAILVAVSGKGLLFVS